MGDPLRIGVWTPGRSECGPLLTVVSALGEVGVVSPDVAADSRHHVAWGRAGFAEPDRDRHLVPVIDTLLHRT